MQFKLKNGKTIETSKMSFYQRKNALEYLNVQVSINEKTRDILKTNHERLFKELTFNRALKKELLLDLKLCTNFKKSDNDVYKSAFKDANVMLEFVKLFDQIYEDNKSEFKPEVIQKEIDDLQVKKIDVGFSKLEATWKEVLRLEGTIRYFKKLIKEIEEFNNIKNGKQKEIIHN